MLWILKFSFEKWTDYVYIHTWQAMSVYYQKEITCLTALLDLTRDSRGLGQVQIIIWAIMFSPIYLIHLVLWLNVWTDMFESLKSSTRDVYISIYVPGSTECKMNLVSEHLTISGTVTWLLPGELTLDVDIWGVQIIIGWRNMTMRPFWY